MNMRFFRSDGSSVDGPGLSVPCALMRLQRHPEEFVRVVQLPFERKRMDWSAYVDSLSRTLL